MSMINIKYEDISQVANVSYAVYANDFLNLGWLLLDVHEAQFSLGWPKSKGPVQFPPKRDPFTEFITHPNVNV